MIADPLFQVAAADVAPTNGEWYTPRWLFDAAGITFDMDVSAPVAEEFRTCPARRYLTVLDDGLTAPWEGLVWMNPPYSRPLPWVERFAAHPGGGLALLAATKSASTQAMLKCADAAAFFGGQFHRVNGDTDHNPWLLLLAARGFGARLALGRIARAWGAPAWVKDADGRPCRSGASRGEPGDQRTDVRQQDSPGDRRRRAASGIQADRAGRPSGNEGMNDGQ